LLFGLRDIFDTAGLKQRKINLVWRNFADKGEH